MLMLSSYFLKDGSSGIRTGVLCPLGLRRMDAPKSTEAGWKEQTGCLRLEAESPYLQEVYLIAHNVNAIGLFFKRLSTKKIFDRKQRLPPEGRNEQTREKIVES